MLNKVKNFYKKYYSNYPDYCYFSPGRINIIGEHIDYNGGYVLPMAITLGIYGLVSYTNDSIITVVSNDYNDTQKFEVYDLTRTNTFDKYIKAVIYIFNKHKYQITRGFNLYLYTTLPISSGLSSSAALELLIAHILNDQYNFGISDINLVKYSQEAEREFVLVNCGIMDQFAIGMSKKNKAIHLNTATLDYNYVDFDLDNACFLILNTNKPRNLCESKYNERREECNKALKILNEINNRDIKDLCDFNMEIIENCKNELGDVLYRRARHVITENNRVSSAVIAMQNKDYEMLGQLLYLSHESLMNDYEVTGLHLDTIYKGLKECNGVFGGRMCGAGFGGCAIALVEKDCVLAIVKKVSEIYSKKTGIKLDYYVSFSSDKTKRIGK